MALRDLRGRKVVLVFHLQGTGPTAREINRAAHVRFPHPGEVLVASVRDLSIVPPVYFLSYQGERPVEAVLGALENPQRVLYDSPGAREATDLSK